MADSIPGPLVAIVGVCGAGKTTLAAGLRARSINARSVLQEHSYVPDMWARITKPDLLVYLDASLDTVRRRRRDPDFPTWLVDAEIERLRRARERCDFYVQTDDLTPSEVLDRVLEFLEAQASKA